MNKGYSWPETKLEDKPVLIFGPKGEPLKVKEKNPIGFGKPENKS
jgi:hypothetical protein